ncbi:glycosyltransferase family 17 protein [Acephala macrosclerotiorum]|nr:glycosyltransferase family 17 protein [Acephala macrosclerotiorum]
MAFGFGARDRLGKRKTTSTIWSRRNSFKLITILLIFSFCVFFFRQNLAYGGHKHAISPTDLELEEDYLRSNTQLIDSNGFLNPVEAAGYCSNHGWNAFPRRDSRRKIYDLFMINTELDWLEIRLNELHHHVDYFVILESASTFTGLPKPLILNDSWGNFTKFKDQIIYHVLEDPDPKRVKEEGWTQWDHEKHQRNAMFEQVLPRLSGPQAPNPEDVILVSDIDEIPRPASLIVLRNCEFPKRLTLRSRFYYYSFQWLHRGSEWAHPQATTYSSNSTILPQDLRGGHGSPFFDKEKADLYNAAWHCSSCFATIEEMLGKMQSFSHVEYNEKKFRKKDWIVEHIRKGRDLWDRWGQWYLRIEANQDVPAYVAGQKERFGYLLDRDGESAGFVDYMPGDAEEIKR